MTRHALVKGAMMAALFLGTISAQAAEVDPDWPCVQRKVPQLSLGQVWNGPELPEAAEGWRKDSAVSALVERVSVRRLALDDAKQDIKDFAATLKDDEAPARLAMVAQGLFDHMNSERTNVISGISRYAHGQIVMAANVRKQSADVDKLRNDPSIDPAVIEKEDEKLAFAIRIFTERVQSLTYVCEVPTLIERRLYQLEKTIEDTKLVK